MLDIDIHVVSGLYVPRILPAGEFIYPGAINRGEDRVDPVVGQGCVGYGYSHGQDIRTPESKTMITL